MPSILGANSVRDNYQIENSLRSEADDSPKLSKTVFGHNPTVLSWIWLRMHMQIATNLG